MAGSARDTSYLIPQKARRVFLHFFKMQATRREVFGFLEAWQSQTLPGGGGMRLCFLIPKNWFEIGWKEFGKNEKQSVQRESGARNGVSKKDEAKKRRSAFFR